MGKSNRTPRRFKDCNKPQEDIKIAIEDSIEVVEDQLYTEVTPVQKPQVAQHVIPHNPNSAAGLLNNILTTLLNQEYARLQQQLLNIKQQLDAQKLITQSTQDSPPVDLYTDVEDTKNSEVKPV